MKAGKMDKLTLQHRLQNFLLTYRSTPHATTKKTLAFLFLGRELRTRLDLLKPGAEERVVDRQADQKRHHDTHVRERSLNPGDRVLVRNKTDWIPGVVLQSQGPLTYLVRTDDGRNWKRHIDLLKRVSSSCSDYYAPSPSEPESSVVEPSSSDQDNVETSDSNPDATDQSEATMNHYPQRQRRQPDRYQDTYMYT